MVKEVKLNDRQQEAVDYSEGPLLVLAGPGTGKTQLLSARVERILKETDAPAETILCLTFTESGAANMRERLASTIGREAQKVNIHTYHAFGQVILAAYKNYAEHFDRAMDAPIDTVAQYKMVAEIQKGLPAMDILRGDNTADIVATIASAKVARLTADDLRRVAEANIDASAQISSDITPVMNKIVPRMKFEAALPIYEEVRDVLVKYSSAEEVAPRIEPVANDLLRTLNEIIEEQKAVEKPKLGALSAWKTKNFEKQDNGSFRLKDHIANKKLLSLAGIMKQYDEALAAAGLYDFADMIEEAIAILKRDQGFRLSMSERFQHILLDEFQDTNPSQAELIRLITDYELPDVMAVGDDDQAIFEFQGANASNLYDFQQHYNAHLVNLEMNYRSYGEIVDTAKRVSEQIEGSFSRQSGIEKLLRAFRNTVRVLPQHIPQKNCSTDFFGGPPSCVTHTVSRHEFISSDAEYYWVAEQIAELVKSGVPQSDIAVIMPKHKNIAPLLPYLRSHPEVKVAYEKRDDLFLDPKLSQLITLAEFVGDLAGEKPAAHRLLEILSFPFWGISEIAALKAVQTARERKKSALDYLAEAEDQKLRRLAEFVAALAMRSFDTPLELFFDYMTGAAPLKLASGEFRSPFIQYYADLGEYESFELYENLAVLKEQIKKYVRNENPRLSDMLQFVADYRLAGMALVNTSPYRESADAVQIVTAHKSKGLEWPYVFMMSVDSAAWGKAKGNNNTLSLPRNVTQIRHTGITEDERRRLLFVAMTRARDVLVMTNALHDFAGKSPKRLEYLDEREVKDENGEEMVISPYLPEDTQRVALHYTDLEESKRCTDLKCHWSAAYLKPDPDMRALLMEQAKNLRLSATDITTFVDIAYAGPMEFYRRKLLRAPSEPATFATEYGNLIHAVFERVTNAGISNEEAVEMFRKGAEAAALEPAERKALLEKGVVALEKSLAKFAAILRSPKAKAEVNFATEHLSFGEVPVTGKLDNIIVDDAAKTIEIYDYKTGNFHKEKWGSHMTLYKYALQLTFYKLLLAASPTYAKYQVTKACILFVSPDAEGEVNLRNYEFDAEDEETVRALAEKIYRLATSLAFLDDNDLKIEPDKNRNLKEIKAFIGKLLG